MSEQHFRTIDHMLGAIVVGLATLLFAVPFALILLAPTFGGL